ncbi:MAG TPA: response regulator [Lacunisphaera sp.]|jgi:DNA-binding NarL/FixJ family response regulator|nr:response regulator [Lacunisphaera sp.]
MKPDTADLTTPRVLLLDDERQIHASVKLRTAGICNIVSAFAPDEGLAAIAREPFDLCLVDIHMPGIDGLEFIELARKSDPGLGFVILTGFDSEENLRRAIPLQVLELISKPLPDRLGFEKRLPEWVQRTRMRRRELALAQETAPIMQDLDVARIERDVESTASESAREALLQSANLLTTVQALLLSTSVSIEKLRQTDPALAGINRGLQEARKYLQSATDIVEGYFNSAYADRECSPALIDVGIKHAMAISLRLARADEQKKAIDLSSLQKTVIAVGLTGMDFLLMLVPALCNALELAPEGSTTQVTCREMVALDSIFDEPARKHFLWINRKHASIARSGVIINIRSTAAASESAELGAWVRGEPVNSLRIPSRGLLLGLQKCKGVLGFGIRPHAVRYEMLIALPA